MKTGKGCRKGGSKMIQAILYLAIGAAGIAAVLLLALVLNRSKSYHSYMVRQCNAGDEEYDRIYLGK